MGWRVLFCWEPVVIYPLGRGSGGFWEDYLRFFFLGGKEGDQSIDCQ